MSSCKFVCLDGLKELLHEQNVVGAKQFLECVVKFFDNHLSKTELDLALEVIFEDSKGTVGFLKKSLRDSKRFKDCNVLILNLWIKIFEDHGKETNLEPYVDDIMECCQKYIISTEVSAKEKERATVVLQEIFRNKVVEHKDVSGLVNRLLDVFNIKTRPVTFTQQVLRLLGIISRDAPDNIIGQNDVLIRDIFLKTLEETLLNEEGIENNALSGAMEGLNWFLVNFAPSPEEEQHYCQRIYACVKKLSNPPDYVRQKAPFRASLDLFTAHSNLFSNQIYNDFSFWNNSLSKWLSSNIYDDRRKGIYAIHAFHKIVSERIKNECPKSEEILHFLILYFRSILESPTSRAYETRIAIRGFGLLSASCRKYYEELSNDMLSLVIQRTELIAIAEDNEMRESLEHFPDYIQAISQMILDVDDVKIIQALSHIIKNIMVRFVKDFYYLSKAHTGLTVNALCSSFYNLMEANGSLFEDVMEKVVLQSVIWTCSHKIGYEAANDWGTDIDWKDNITYKNFMPLWEGLLDESPHSSLNKPLIAKSVFNNLISALLLILEKLDLRIKRRAYTDESGKDKEFFFCDPNIDLCPVRPKDFYIFFNITDFYRDIFNSKYKRQNFHDWIEVYCTKMLRYAVKNPLVSGFLKLLELGLNVAEYLKFFEADPLTDNNSLRDELSYFLKSIILKSQRVSGEIQLSCLELILKFPPHFFGEYLKYLVPIFASAFVLGKSMTWLAKLAINCLEKICDTYQESIYDLRKFYQHVLPNLNSYLQSTCSFDDMNVKIFNYKNRKRIRKGVTEKIGDAELLLVQKKILSFLGKLDPEDVACVISRNDEDLVKWDTSQIIRLSLYLPDMHTNIFLDSLVPRICNLAVSSTDRIAKIAACEFVHTLVLYLLGTKQHRGRIWSELCTRMLILGSDGDATVQQMFEPLLSQVMHFMARYENLNHGVETLMDALMDGISNSSNCSIRDLSAICLREFVEWSIKQTTPEQLAASPVSIQMILERLQMYSIDSNAARRTGAALAFNNLYRILREEESICDIFFIDLFYTFCINFRISEDLSLVPLNDLDSDLEIVAMSLDHIVRVLIEREYLFNKETERRNIPTGMGKGTLKDIVMFLIKESGTRLMHFRHKCVEMALTVVRKVIHISSLTMYLQRYSDTQMLQIICEGGPEGSGIFVRPDLKHIKSLNSIPQVHLYCWLENFLCALDSYCWMLGDFGVQNPKPIFEKANIFQVISYYLENICWYSVYEIIERLNENSHNETSSTAVRVGTEEHNRIDSIKCIITVRIFDFLAVLIKSDCALLAPDNFWSNNQEVLSKLVTQIIFEPQKLYFDFRSEEIAKNIPTRLQNFLRYLQKCPQAEPVTLRLHQHLKKMFFDFLEEISDSAKATLSADKIHVKQKNIVRGLIFVFKDLNGLIATETVQLRQTTKTLCNLLYSGICQNIFNKEVTVQPTPEAKKHVNNLMRICFIANFDEFPETITKMILNQDVLMVQGSGTSVTRGEHFFHVYKSSLLEGFKNGHLTNMFTNIFAEINNGNVYYIIKILIELAGYIQKFANSDKCSILAFSEVCLSNLNKLLSHFVNSENDVQLYELMHQFGILQIQKLETFKNVSSQLEDWIVNRMRNPKCSLEQKSRATSMLALVLSADVVENRNISNALEEMQRQHFPLKSTEFAPNSLEETSYKLAFSALIGAMVSSQSFVLLEFLIKCTAADQKHLLEYIIRDEMKIFTVSLSSEQQLSFVSRVFEMILKDNLEPTVRLSILERFLYNLLRNSTLETVHDFAVKYIAPINNLMDSELNLNKSTWEIEQALVNRIIGFSMIEVIFGLLPTERYTYKESPIAVAMLKNPSSDRELVGALTKKAFYVRKEVVSSQCLSVKEFFRLYQCAGYRAICALVSNTQNEIKYYSKFLFEENPSKKDFIWQLMIDCSPGKVYIFNGQEFERYPRTKERFVAIRKLNVVPNVNQKLYQSSRQMQTQNVFESSLRAEVSKIDMNYSSVRTNTQVMSRMDTISRENRSVCLERHELNKHEIMPTLCGVIQHMHENAINPVITDVNIKRTYPWISAIANEIGNATTHKNIRIFLAQLVDNCREVFEPYAHVLYQPFLAMLVDECAGPELNFFITDMIALLLSWSSKGIHSPKSTDEITLASDLLKLLMKNCWSDKREILKFNLELIQTTISLWKDVISVPTQLLYEMLTRSKKDDSKANEPSLILLGIVLSFELIPWSERLKTPFVQAVLLNLTNQNCGVYQPAAHVAGMTMATLRRIQDNNTADNMNDEIVVILKKLCAKRDNQSEKMFRDVLYGVQKMCPTILEEFGEIVPFKIPTAIGTMKTIYLEMLLTRIDLYNAEEMFTILVSIGIKSLLLQNEYQLISLHILNKSLSKLRESEIASIFSIIESCLESKQVDSRQVVYEILIEIMNSGFAGLKVQCAELLFKGLADVDTNIKKRLFQYWSQEVYASMETTAKLTSLIQKYATNGGKEFLGFCVQLVLESSVSVGDSKKQIFAFETDRDSKFLEYEINTQSRVRNSSTLAPLFAETQIFRQSLISGTQRSHFLRATCAEQFFEPTQDPGALHRPKQNFTLQTQGSLPFSLPNQILNRKSQKIGQERRATQVDNENDMNYFRKRFLRDKDKEKREKVLKVIDYKARQLKRVASQLKSTEGQVVLYRRYRFGDYPDLLINNLAFLLPLQGIAERDSLVARQLFASLFSSIINELKSEAKDFINEVGSSIEMVLSNSKTCDPTTFATFLEISLMKPNMFNISASSIAIMAKATNKLTMGVLYLEEQLNDWDDEKRSVSIRSSSTVNPEDKIWLHLSDIYSSLREYDIVASIFSDKIQTDPRLAEAIELKANGFHKYAQDLLNTIIERGVEIEQYYAYNCFYDCYMDLGDWSSLSKSIYEQLDDTEELWTDDYNTRFLLPKLMQSELHLILQGDAQNKDFLQTIESWIRDPVKMDHMQTAFSEELMMLHIANENFIKARVYCENFIKAFLSEWGVINSLGYKLKLDSLLNAQKVAEIDQYAIVLMENFNENSIKRIEKRWNNCKINSYDSLRFWNSLVAYRTYTVALFSYYLQNTQTQSNLSGIMSSVNKMSMQIFNAAVKQNNIGLADMYLKRLESSQDSSDHHQNFIYELARAKFTLLKSQQITDRRNKIESLKQSWLINWDTISNEQLKLNPQCYLESLSLNAKISDQMFKEILKGNLDTNVESDLKMLAFNSSSQSTLQRIFDHSIHSLKSAVEFAKDLFGDSEQYEVDSKQIASSYYNLAEFCYDHVENQNLDNREEIEKTLIRSVLQAMQYNSNEAKQLFACLLQLPSILNGRLRDYFVENCSGVPEWMFLRWIPQIMSHFELEEYCYLDDIVIRISAAYPNALKYPFNLWFERVTDNKNISNVSVLRKEIREIMENIKDPLTDKFVECFKYLCLPEVLVISNLEKLSKLVSKAMSQENYKSIVDKILLEIYPADESIQGSAYRERILKYRQSLTALRTYNVKTEYSTIGKAVLQIMNELRDRLKTFTREIRLEKLSPWLANFQWCANEHFIELPGQYSENFINKRPVLETHVNIVKIDRNVSVFVSQRHPIRLKFYGSNAKSYDFLIKVGEDLKQDQRIQQILSLMSDKLSEDQNCWNHNLFVQTYQVIPVHTNCGMLSWVENAAALREFIQDCFGRRVPNSTNILEDNIESYFKFLYDASSGTDVDKSNLSVYGKAAVAYTRDRLLQNFRTLEHNIPAELLKYALADIAVSPEAFFALRNNFATSLAAMNISNWVLGIGDRHLQNILINTKDGSLTGIDFGVTFGSGTRDLSIPELVPFRLTPHLINALSPMGTSGLLFKCMAHTLRVFRNSKKILAACMDVFVREPTINWLNVENPNELGSENSQSSWEPKDRIEIACAKLEGYNPMVLFERELNVSVVSKNPEFLEAYIRILKGNNQFNIRARLPSEDLTVEDQVKCLIDQATDPSILGISYAGYLPWI